MRCALALLVVGLLLTMGQGAAAIFIPAYWCPDLRLLLVVGMGLCWRSSAGGVTLALLLGYVGDLLSGTFFGQHALMQIGVYGAARLGSGQLNLRGGLPQAAFVAILTVVHATALAATTAFFAPGISFAFPAPGPLAAHAATNAIFAPLVTGGVAWLVALLSPDEAGRRLLRLEPRSFGA